MAPKVNWPPCYARNCTPQTIWLDTSAYDQTLRADHSLFLDSGSSSANYAFLRMVTTDRSGGALMDDMDLPDADTKGTTRASGHDDPIIAEGARQRGPGRDVSKRVDLLDAVRVASVPVSLGTSAWTGSPWWFVGVMVLYSVAGGPVHDFLGIVLSAAAERLARRIRDGPGRSPPSPSS
jgi:hypothetical protein